MEKPDRIDKYLRIIYRSPEYESFYEQSPPRVQLKFDYVINVIATVYNVPAKFIKHLENTDLYEMRVSVGTNEYRTIIFALDNANVIEATKIILLNAFLKKDTKDYRKQIAKAISIYKKLEL